jgi:hypothetical protein
MRTVIPAAIVAATGLVLASSASASCHNIRCLTQEVTQLTRTVKSQGKQLNADTKFLNTLANCMGEFPLSEFGDSAGTYGYVYTPSPGATGQYTTALDLPTAGQPVGAWVLSDKCNTASAVRHVAHTLRQPAVFGPIAATFRLTPIPR